MRLSKHHGLGNDFLVVLDPTRRPPVGRRRWRARRLCDRHRGIGADGLIVGRRRSDERMPRSCTMVLRNADGSRAEMSGNGIRCLAQAVVRRRRRPRRR